MTANEASLKLSHADADEASRESKALRIVETLSSLGVDFADSDVLDIGTGSGIIASCLATKAKSLVSIDIVDERTRYDFNFELMISEALPGADESFDLVISNHVIEHVDDQLQHLLDIRRVLRPNGVCYLATPNQFWPMEPHFDLPLLSWLPRSVADAYVRKAGRGNRYDASLVTGHRLASLANYAGLEFNDISFTVANAVTDKRFGISLGALSPAWPLLWRFLPSLVGLLRKEDTNR